MFPFRYSSIFRSRWIALFWAAGILWLAYDAAGGGDDAAGNNAQTDATGMPLNQADIAAMQDELNLLHN
jgi:hypothetical protein